MAKKYPPGYIKNPAKVAAGKARAAQSFRIKGKYVRREFIENYIKPAAQINNAKDLHQYFLQNEKTFEETYLHENLSTYRNSNQIKKDIAGYDGKIYINGKLKTGKQAIAKITRLKQFLRNDAGVVDFSMQMTLSNDGHMKIKIPEISQLKNEDGEPYEEEEMLDILGDEYDIQAYISDAKKQNK